MPQIYVIYRHEDARKKSKEIIAILEKNYGVSNVHSPDYDGYVDVYAIENDIKMADYVLVIIGNYWADMVDESGINLLNSVYDPVHMAIATGINSRKQLIPILVDGAPMPHPSRLPRELRKLTTQDPIKLNKNDPLEKSLNKGLKDIIKQGSRIQIPNFVSQAKQLKQPEASPAQPLRRFQQQSQQSQRPYQPWMMRAIWVAIAIAVTIIIMAFLLVPTRREAPVAVTSYVVEETSLQVTIVPPTLIPTRIPPTTIPSTSIPSLPKITVDNASQLALIEDRVATASPTDLVLFSGDQTFYIFLSTDLQEVQLQEIATLDTLKLINTAPYDPLAIQLNEDETQLWILLSNGQVMVWGVPIE